MDRVGGEEILVFTDIDTVAGPVPAGRA